MCDRVRTKILEAQQCLVGCFTDLADCLQACGCQHIPHACGKSNVLDRGAVRQFPRRFDVPTCTPSAPITSICSLIFVRCEWVHPPFQSNYPPTLTQVDCPNVSILCRSSRPYCALRTAWIWRGDFLKEGAPNHWARPQCCMKTSIRGEIASQGRNPLTVHRDGLSIRAGARERWCTMRDEFASKGFLAVTVAGLVLLCSGFVAFAFT